MSEVSEAVARAVRNSMPTPAAILQELALAVANALPHQQAILQELSAPMADIVSAMTRPSVLYRPTLTKVGSVWFATYGAFHVAAPSPAQAMFGFDQAWI
jgi:hypothetical protein